MGALVVSGTERPVTLEITNLTPQVVRLAGGNPLVVRSSGGDENRSAVSYQAVGPGGFQLSATVIEREDD
jgi:hypothetical protein